MFKVMASLVVLFASSAIFAADFDFPPSTMVSDLDRMAELQLAKIEKADTVTSKVCRRAGGQVRAVKGYSFRACAFNNNGSLELIRICDKVKVSGWDKSTGEYVTKTVCY